MPAVLLRPMHRHAEAEAAWAVSAELTWQDLTEVAWRAFTEVTLAMERAFAEVALQFWQRLRLGKLRQPTVTPALICPCQHLAQSRIDRSEACCRRRLRVQV